MQHGVGKSGQAAQRRGIIEIAQYLVDTQGPQCRIPCTHQRMDPPAPDEQWKNAADDIAATDDQ